MTKIELIIIKTSFLHLQYLLLTGRGDGNGSSEASRLGLRRSLASITIPCITDADRGTLPLAAEVREGGRSLWVRIEIAVIK